MVMGESRRTAASSPRPRDSERLRAGPRPKSGVGMRVCGVGLGARGYAGAALGAGAAGGPGSSSGPTMLKPWSVTCTDAGEGGRDRGGGERGGGGGGRVLLKPPPRIHRTVRYNFCDGVFCGVVRYSGGVRCIWVLQ